MRNLTSLVVVTFLAVSLVAPVGSAHPAPLPRSYETRVLHDHSDDWGGHAVSRDGHDLIALDIRELHDVSLGGDTLALRLIMNGGWARAASEGATLSETIAFTADGEDHVILIETADNKAFTGDCDRIEGPMPVLKPNGSPDGSRFAVECFVAFPAMGVDVGSVLAGFKVIGRANERVADEMPGGALGPVGEEAAYTRPELALAGPTQYAEAGWNEDGLTLEEGALQAVDLTVTNPLSTDQNVTIVLAGDDVDASFENGVVWAGPLAAGADRTFTVDVQALEGGSDARVAAIVKTSLGGRTEVVLPVTVQAPATTEGPSSEAGGEAEGETPVSTQAPEPSTAAPQTPAPDMTHMKGDAAKPHAAPHAGEKGVVEESPSGAFVVFVLLGLAALGIAARRRV